MHRRHRTLSRFVTAAAALALACLILAIRPAHAQLGVYDSVPPHELSAEPALEWVQAIYNRLREERLNPPEAARVYGYMGITLYESVIAGWPENRSLSGQVNGLGDVPLPEAGLYDWLTVMNSALRTLMVDLMIERGDDNIVYFDDLYASQLADRSAEIDADIIERSVDYGEEIGKMVVDWASTDGYAELLPNTAYVFPDAPNLWVPTTPGTLPTEPFWGEVRPFVLPYTDICADYDPMFFSTEPDSTFYQQALEVMNTVDDLTPEQIEIAAWWMDDPGDTGLPSGHWVEIASYILAEDDASLLLTGEVYGMLGMTLADSFIAAWSLKYEMNVMRPVTYINEYISTRWQPYIESPFFPEYPSAHSVVSMAAADILEFFFGTRTFTDRANEDRGMGVRQFNSFTQAAHEAGMSRLYGGIHYRDGIERGWRIGSCIAETALNTIVMRPLQQG